MLNIIEPKDHQSYQSRIESFLDLLQIYQNFSLTTEEREKATFIIASNNKQGVYGGALLIKQDISVLEKRISQTILTFHPEAKNVWTGVIGFYGECDNNIFPTKALELCLDFYLDLLESFILYGSKRNFKYLCLTLNVNEYLKMADYAFWEHIAKVLPQASSDYFFHSILSLNLQKIGGIK